MNQTEIRETLDKMGALPAGTGPEAFNPYALMQDPIVTNRLAVELLQRVDRAWKPEVVASPVGVSSYFGYSVALAAWMRFVCADVQSTPATLPDSVRIKKKEKTLIVLDSYDEDTANSLIELVRQQEAKPLAVLCLIGKTRTGEPSLPHLCLID